VPKVKISRSGKGVSLFAVKITIHKKIPTVHKFNLIDPKDFENESKIISV
jgi:hypothetical protein